MRWPRWPALRIYIVHLSCNDALEKIREARDRGLPVYAETCPQYLYLSLENMDAPGFEGAKYVFTPPLREKWNQDKLWNGLKHDHLQVVSTDHCPFCFKEQKEMGRDDFTKIPNGGPGVEHRMSLIYSGGVASGRFSAEPFCGTGLDDSGETVWTISRAKARSRSAATQTW